MERSRRRNLGRMHSSHPSLTRREREIAGLVAEGLTNVGIAQRLSISKRTVESHVEHVKKKLSFASRLQIIVWVIEHRADEQDQPPISMRSRA
jgi:DNA-binding CsgD family transcriptional regulator